MGIEGLEVEFAGDQEDDRSDDRQSTVARVGMPAKRPGAASVSSGSRRSNPGRCHRPWR